jgi:hypothetical protein
VCAFREYSRKFLRPRYTLEEVSNRSTQHGAWARTEELPYVYSTCRKYFRTYSTVHFFFLVFMISYLRYDTSIITKVRKYESTKVLCTSVQYVRRATYVILRIVRKYESTLFRTKVPSKVRKYKVRKYFRTTSIHTTVK